MTSLRRISIILLLVGLFSILSFGTMAQETSPIGVEEEMGVTIFVSADEIPTNRQELLTFLISNDIPVGDASNLADLMMTELIPQINSQPVPATSPGIATTHDLWEDERNLNCPVSAVAWWQQGTGAYVSTMYASDGNTDPVPGISDKYNFYGIHYARIDETFERGRVITKHKIQVNSAYLHGYYANCLGF